MIRERWIPWIALGVAAVAGGGVGYVLMQAARQPGEAPEMSPQEAWRAVERESARVERLAAERPAPADAPTPDAERLLADVRALSYPRDAVAPRARARGYLSHALLEVGLEPVQHAFRQGVNVQAERPGTDPAAGVLLLVAHYDTVPGSPGADDDASGVAVALEMARLFAARPTPRGLRVVFFDQEERGYLGSRAYVAAGPGGDERLRGVVGVVSLEMLGYRCLEPGCQRYPAGLPIPPPRDRGDFLAAVGGFDARALLAALVRASGPADLPVVALPLPGRGGLLPDARRSDHAPFWDAGVPAVMLTDTAESRSPHYHRASDTFETLDPEFLAGAARLVALATTDLLLNEPRGSSPPE